MKNLLLPYYGDDLSTTALHHAVRVAAVFDSAITGLFVTRPPQIVEAEGIALAGAYVTQLREEWQRRALAAEQSFRDTATAAGFTVAPRDGVISATDARAAAWTEVEGQEGQVLGEYGRVFDLLVLARNGAETLVDWQLMAEAAFFESGRPTLLAASTTPDTIGERVMIHWNGSTEAARVLSLGMPFILRAKAVSIVELSSTASLGPRADAVARNLERHGLNVEVFELDREHSENGQAILAQAGSWGADLLVKGAYTQSRLRQLVFGGATRHILTHATLPVLLAR